MIPLESIAGVVLCGGESRRMGRDKASLPFHGETLLDRVVRRLSAIVRPIVVVARPGQSLPTLPPEVVVEFDPVAGQGPWPGIAAGLRRLCDRDALFVVGCDQPFVEPAWIRALAERIGEHDCAVAIVDGVVQPLAGLYRPRVADVVERLLRENRPPRELFDHVPTRRIPFEDLAAADPHGRTLTNINTPEEYRDALEEGDPP